MHSMWRGTRHCGGTRFQRLNLVYSSNQGMSASVRSTASHEERTAQQPREWGIHPVTLNRIEQATQDVRLLRLVPHGQQPVKV